VKWDRDFDRGLLLLSLLRLDDLELLLETELGVLLLLRRRLGERLLDLDG
jgi:hypothetical protein